MDKKIVLAALATPQGIALVDEIIKSTKARSTPISLQNTNQQFFNLGRQEVGQELLKIKQENITHEHS